MPTLPKRAVHLSALLVALLVAAALFLLCALRPAHAGGSLNPEPDEYYTLYCANDLLEVWRSTPAPLLLATVAIAEMLLLPEGGELTLPDSMSVERRTPDTLAVLGSNGNGAPAAGEKDGIAAGLATTPSVTVQSARPASDSARSSPRW